MKRIRKVVEVPAVEAVEERKHFSFSQIDLYINCARKYKFRYIDKIPVEGLNINMRLGTFVHEYNAEVLTARLTGTDLTVRQRDELRQSKVDALKLAVDKYLESAELDYTQEVIDEVEYITGCLRRITIEWDKIILPDFDPLAVEQKIELQIGGVPFLMYIDAIQKLNKKDERIIDWKVTGKTKSKFQADNSLQLSIYSIATGIRNVAFVALIRPTKGKTNAPRIETTTSTRAKYQLDWAEEIIKDVVKGINKNYFPRCGTDNFLCNSTYCEYWNMCRGEHEPVLPSWL